ncbi:MAG: divalent metal cation transporter [Verrucomicrobiales bacterium]|nr:divalent metal cation transporter [Verrucomicrobiales bacterium]
MSESSVEQEAAELAEMNQQGIAKRYGYYARKSGPGWLQGAITLGGGSLGGALFLGSFMGYNMMWLQPLAMILGVIMLSAISYVTLSTGERPFLSVMKNVSPVLAWAWLIATLMANIVWCMPQFALGTGAIRQNLGGSAIPVWGCGILLLAVGVSVNYFYGRGSKGVATFELILKILVGIVVVSFFGVVVALTASKVLDWGAVFKGLIPNLKMFESPAPTFDGPIAATGEFAQFWKDKITHTQRDVIISAFATAVGINMTFLLPYSMLKKRWGKAHRPLAIFDLSIGLIIPFVIATGCVVIASASQFHTKYSDVLYDDGAVNPQLEKSYNEFLDSRIQAERGDAFTAMTAEQLAAARGALPLGDRQLAAMLVKRDNLQLAAALEPLAGKAVSQFIFGIGVIGMAVSTIIILMLINGFTFCEMLGKPGDQKTHMLGAVVAGVGGFLGPIWLWTGASKAALAIPTSVIGGSLLPIAYFTFLLLMNSKKVLGSSMMTGGRRIYWNTLMVISTSVATFASIWALKDKSGFGIPFGKIGIGVLVLLFVVGTVGFLGHNKKADKA